MGFVKKFVFFHFGPKNGGFGGLNRFEPPIFANLFGIFFQGQFPSPVAKWIQFYLREVEHMKRERRAQWTFELKGGGARKGGIDFFPGQTPPPLLLSLLLVEKMSVSL